MATSTTSARNERFSFETRCQRETLADQPNNRWKGEKKTMSDDGDGDDGALFALVVFRRVTLFFSPALPPAVGLLLARPCWTERKRATSFSSFSPSSSLFKGKTISQHDGGGGHGRGRARRLLGSARPALSSQPPNLTLDHLYVRTDGALFVRGEGGEECERSFPSGAGERRPRRRRPRRACWLVGGLNCSQKRIDEMGRREGRELAFSLFQAARERGGGGREGDEWRVEIAPLLVGREENARMNGRRRSIPNASLLSLAH